MVIVKVLLEGGGKKGGGKERERETEGGGRKEGRREENWREAKPPQAIHLDRSDLSTNPTVIKVPTMC